MTEFPEQAAKKGRGVKAAADLISSLLFIGNSIDDPLYEFHLKKYYLI